MNLLVYLIRWVFYGCVFVFFTFYSILLFLSKPGTRVLFPTLIIGLAAWQHDFVQSFFLGIANSIVGETNANASVAWGLAGLAVFIVSWCYVFLSRLIGLFLGIFPPLRRPLMPIRKLQAPKGANTRPAVVRLAVPALPRRK